MVIIAAFWGFGWFDLVVWLLIGLVFGFCVSDFGLLLWVWWWWLVRLLFMVGTWFEFARCGFDWFRVMRVVLTCCLVVSVMVWLVLELIVG